MLDEDGADEGAEVGGGINDEDAGPVFFVRLVGEELSAVGGDGFLLGGEGLEYGGDHGEVEQGGDEAGRGCDAEIAAALAEGGHVADQETEADAVEPMDVCEGEDKLGVGEGALVEGVFESLGFAAEGDSAGAADDMDAVYEGGFDGKVHDVFSWIECNALAGKCTAGLEVFRCGFRARIFSLIGDGHLEVFGDALGLGDDDGGMLGGHDLLGGFGEEG